MHDLNVALATIGAVLLLFGLFSGFMRAKVKVLSEPLTSVLFGIVLGPAGFDLLRLHSWGDPLVILEEVSRIALAVSVMATALRLPDGYFRQNLRAMAIILGPGMLLMWLFSGSLSYLFFDLSIWAALVLGAVLTPTDPVVAGTIVAGEVAERDIPPRVRFLLSGEAGANDGGAYPFVLFGILMLQRPPADALTHWFTVSVLWNIGMAVVLGLLIGYCAGRIEKWSEDAEFAEKTSVTTVTIALSLFVLGAVKLVGCDGILAVFVAGVTFRKVADKRDEAQESRVQSAVNHLFGYPVFIFFGMALPWGDWAAFGWAGVAFAVAILLLRRLPMLCILRPWLPPVQRRADMLFAGWFGPIGVAAIYYATVAERKLHDETFWILASLVVFASALAHGSTSTPLTRCYHRVTGEPSKDN